MAHVLNSKVSSKKTTTRSVSLTCVVPRGSNRIPHQQAGTRSQAGSAMGPSEEGVLFVPCLGRWDATQGPRAEISRHPPRWVRPVPWGGGGARAPRERRWGGGGAGPEARGGGAAAGLLWRPTLGGGGDPPPSTWTVAEAWADALTPGRGGRQAAAAATAGAARGRGRLTVAEPSLGAPLRPFYGPGRRRRVRVRLALRPRRQRRRAVSRRSARPVDGESCAEGSRTREAPPPSSPPLTDPGRSLRRSNPGRGP